MFVFIAERKFLFLFYAFVHYNNRQQLYAIIIIIIFAPLHNNNNNRIHTSVHYANLNTEELFFVRFDSHSVLTFVRQ